MNDSYLEVLKQYEGEVTGVRRGRGAWICEYPDGPRLLKEYRGTVKRLEFEDAVLGQLEQQGICRTDRYVRNLEDGLVTAGPDGVKYILKRWFLERECSLRDRREILFCARQIAQLHRGLQEIPWQEEWNLGSTVAPALSEEMARHSREMRRVRNYIRGKRRKTEFELQVMQSFDAYYAQALEAEKGLEPLDQVSDLYRFMRKVMEKHGWDEYLGCSMLDVYDAMLPMSRNDRRCLYFLFLYPEKYWKQLNYYYNANKAWIPEKNMEKLKTLESQREARRRFLSRIK